MSNNETWHWDIKGEYDRDMPRLLSSTGEEICNFGNRTTYYPTEGSPPMPHHMALIAAAPELLEALQAAIECGMVPSMSARSGGECAHVEQLKVADKIRDAIAKATGADKGI